MVNLYGRRGSAEAKARAIIEPKAISMRILIVDDDQPHGESLVELLSSHGHEAYFAPSYGEAEWLCGLFRFDLSVIDFDMPHHTGPEVAERLRARNPELEVVIISAHRPSGARLTVLGSLPFFPKPIEAASFLSLVEGIAVRLRGSTLIVRQDFPLERRDPR